METTPPEWQKFNLNDRVRVKLTDVGRAEYKRHSDEINNWISGRNADPSILIPTEPTLDAEGFFETELWNAMKLFGERCGNGMPVPIETVFFIKRWS